MNNGPIIDHDVVIENQNRIKHATVQELIEMELESEDPLQKLLIQHGYENEIYPDKLFSALNKETEYKISQVTELLGCKDYHIRNLISRNNMQQYIDYAKTAKLNRFNYLSVYRLYLVFKVQDLLNYQAQDIALQVGVITPQDVSSNSSVSKNSSNTTTMISEEQITNIVNKQMEDSNALMLMYVHLQQEINTKLHNLDKAENVKENWYKEIEDLVEKIELHERMLSITDLQRAAVEGIRRGFKESIKEFNERQPGFWEKLFGIKRTINEAPLTEHLPSVVEQNRKDLERLLDKKSELDGKKEIIANRVDSARRDYLNTLKRYQQHKQNMLSYTDNQIIHNLLLNDPYQQQIVEQLDVKSTQSLSITKNQED